MLVSFLGLQTCAAHDRNSRLRGGMNKKQAFGGEVAVAGGRVL